MQLPANNLIPFLVLIPLVAWRMYSRIRRNIGRQTLSKVRPRITLVLFPLLTVLFSIKAASSHDPALFAALAVGIAGGIMLGSYGLRHTKFEATPQGMFYTPNAHIGIALSVLFVGRIIYRMMVMYSTDPYAQSSLDSFALTPLTLGIFGLLAGYYVTYAMGLVRWGKSVEPPRN